MIFLPGCPACLPRADGLGEDVRYSYVRGVVGVMWDVDVVGELEASSEEVVLADRLVQMVDAFSRVIMATPGSAYQLEKAPAVGAASDRMGVWLSERRAEGLRVRPDVVEALVAILAQDYAAGRALWPLESAPEIPESLRPRLVEGRRRYRRRRVELGIDPD